MRVVWTKDRIEEAKNALRESTRGTEAAEILTAKWRQPVSIDSIDKAFRRRQLVYGDFLLGGIGKGSGIVTKEHQAVMENIRRTASTKKKTKKDKVTTKNKQKKSKTKSKVKAAGLTPRRPDDVDVSELLRIVRRHKGGCTIETIADAMDCSPSKAKRFVLDAQEAGHDFKVDSSGAIVMEAEPQQAPVRIDAPIEGQGWRVLAAMSDLHIGSLHCYEEEITSFVHRAYDYGARDMLIPGDLFEGNLRHHGFQLELKCIGYDDQVALLLSLLPELPGLTYHYCDGNHEFNSWFKTIGMLPGKALMRDAMAIGRDDFNYLGPITGRLIIGDDDPDTDIKVELSHTQDRKAYAISYPIQKHIESIPIGAKPHVLLKAHLHQYSKIDERGVIAVQTACFKGRGYFEQAINIHPKIGGVMMWMRRQGRYFDFKDQYCAVRPEPVIWTQVPGVVSSS